MGIIQVKKDSKFFLDEDFTSDDVNEDIVGRKGDSLFRLKDLDVPVPPFFVISSSIFTKYIADNLNDSISPKTSIEKLRQKIIDGEFDNAIKNDLLTSYSRLSGFTDAWVAVRSSVVPPIDKRELSFAGLLDTQLNVKGLDDLVEAVKAVYASLFTERVANYTASQNTSLASVKVAVVVQKMIQSEASGIFFTLDPISQDKDLMMTEAVFGLGDVIAAGEITPDQYVLDKKTLEFKEKRIVPQEWMMVRKIKRKPGQKSVQKVQISKAWQHQQKIDNRYLKELAEICKKIEKKLKKPQDIEWVIEGSRLWILQTRDVEQPEIKVDEHEKLKINQNIIKSAQEIADKERSRQQIRNSLKKDKNEEKTEKSDQNPQSKQVETQKGRTKPQSKESKDKISKKQSPPDFPAKLASMMHEGSSDQINQQKQMTSNTQSDAQDGKKSQTPASSSSTQLSKPLNKQVVKPVQKPNYPPMTQKNTLRSKPSPQKGEKLILTGIGSSQSSTRGKVILIKDEEELAEKRGRITSNSIVVTRDYIKGIENILQTCAGVISDTGGLTSDISTISRELGIPSIMGCGVASRMLKKDEEILMDGNIGAIYGKRENIKKTTKKTTQPFQSDPDSTQPSPSNKPTPQPSESEPDAKPSKKIDEPTQAPSKSQSQVPSESQPQALSQSQSKASSKSQSQAPSESQPQAPSKSQSSPPTAKQPTQQSSRRQAQQPSQPETQQSSRRQAPKPHTATQLYVNLADSYAKGEKWQDHAQDSDGIAVVQIEDIYRKLDRHPGSFISQNQTKELVNKITSQLSKVCDASNGNTVIASIGSMKVGQYKDLKGGAKFETWENSDNITEDTGGLNRLLKRPQEMSAIIKSIRSVRNVEGWRNISIAVEFAGTPENLIEFKKSLTAGGLRRSSTFSIYLVIDTPSTAMNVEDFIDAGIDGAIINMESLAKFMQAPQVEDESVLRTIENVRNNWKSGTLIVQAPKSPEKIVVKTVKSGIKGLSASPSDLEEIRQKIVETERELVFNN